ncbi:MAG: beta strand repeat-containing protein [Chthoniobacterales bacterium]
MLDSSPVISTANGGTTKLALIAVNGITSNNTGATFTFAGLDTVLLATQAGPINLSGISFQNLGQLFFYARGTGSNLTLGASASGIRDEILQAENNVQVNASQSAIGFHVFAGNDYLTGTGPITVGTLDLTAGHDVNFTTAQYPYGDSFGQTVLVSAGNAVNVDARGDMSVLNNAGLIDVRGLAINVTSDNPEAQFSFRAGTPVQFTAGGGGFNSSTVSYFHPGSLLSITSAGTISVRSIFGGNTLQAGTSYLSQFGTSTISLTAGSTINEGGGLTASGFISAGTTITVGGQLSAPKVTAGGNVTANGVSVRNLSTPTGILQANAAGITPYIAGAGSNVLHTLSATAVRSLGGINFSGARFPEPGSAGGMLTINANSLDLSSTGDIQGAINFNGADATSTNAAGNGGTFSVLTSGAINVGTRIEATTGLQSQFASAAGNGGTVNLESTQSSVIVNAPIVVSSADFSSEAASPPPVRRSARGGNISLKSGAAANVAINIGNSGALLSLLDATAPGPGGKITILATGANSRINVNGPAPGGFALPANVRADRGTIDIRHTGDAGQISLNNAMLRSDIVKVGALGANGGLTIGGGSITADTILRLYSPGSNGTINFIANCTLTGGTQTIIAANSVTIANNVVVTIGGQRPADVYTGFGLRGVPNANYSGFGGNGSTTGTFGGAGANNPKPLASAPAFDGP